MTNAHTERIAPPGEAATRGVITIDDLRRRPSVSVEEAAQALDISRTAAYAAVRSGEIPTVRVGHRYTVPTSALRRMLGISEVPDQPNPGTAA